VEKLLAEGDLFPVQFDGKRDRLNRLIRPVGLSLFGGRHLSRLAALRAVPKHDQRNAEKSN